MRLSAIIRRDGRRNPDDLTEAAARSTDVGDEMADDIRWIRTYVLDEPGGGLGSVCVYQASSEDKVREHASSAGLPVTDVVPNPRDGRVRPDPAAADVVA
jgi:Protein of unknown function (DUF4242)